MHTDAELREIVRKAITQAGGRASSSQIQWRIRRAGKRINQHSVLKVLRLPAFILTNRGYGKNMQQANIRQAIARMVDKAIGEGTVLAVVRYDDGDFCSELPIRGTVLASHEPLIASMIIHRARQSGANPSAVRLVMLRGTWLEAPQWSGVWHLV